MNILFLNKFNDYWKKRFHQLKDEFPKVHLSATFDPNERAAALAAADAVVCGRLAKEEIENSPKLKAVFVPFTGLNNFPLDAIKQRSIILANTHANARYVAEHAVSLAMALLGRVVEFHNDLKKGYWHRSIEGNDMWTTLHGKTICIIGLGNIGLNIAKFIKPFDCRVIGVKLSKPSITPESVDEITNDMLNAIAKSSLVFVSLPLTAKTKNIISADVFSKMKDKYLINIGRGETVNEEGLYNALKDGTLKGAALDVWYNYPGKKEEPVFPSAYPIYELPNVILSPHKSSHTNEAIKAMIDDTFESIRSFIRTSKSPNQVIL